MVPVTTTANTNELLSTKLSPPRMRSPRILRQALVDRLHAGLNQKLTLLSAPAGFGKTTLVIEWIESLRESTASPETPVAWIALDSGDNDPVRFWRYVFTAVQAFNREAGRQALARLQASQQPAYEAVLTGLINQLSLEQGKNIIILEDYYCITNVQVHAAVTFLLDHLPPSLHLVLITRYDPPLHLARLRAHNEVNELRTPELRFSEAETRAFLQQVMPPGIHGSRPLPPEVPARLAERTEGWAAGLRLVTLALKTRQAAGEQERFLDTFTGSHRPILEYLAADVLASQKEALQEFLLETSFLNRLTGSLCDAVTGRRDSSIILDQLESLNLFLEPLDGAGQWYRFHALFAEAMQYTALQRLGETRVRQLACNASWWYESNAMLSEAVETALFSQDFPRAAGLIERMIEPRLVGNEFHTLLRWIQILPETVLSAHPELCITLAQAILFTGEAGSPVPVNRLAAPLEMAARYWMEEGNESELGKLLALRALISIRQGNFVQAFGLARQALARLPETEMEWRGISLIFTGLEEMYAGQLVAARQTFSKARACCQASGNTYGLIDATFGLGEICAKQAEPQQSGELYRQVLADLEDASINRKEALSRQGRAWLGLAGLAYERNDFKAAEEGAAQAILLSHEFDGEELRAYATWILARIQRARGQIEAARGRLNTLSAQIKHPRLLREVQGWQAWLALAAGDLAGANRWRTARSETFSPPAVETGLPVLFQEQEALVLAQVQIAQGEVEEALHQLGDWLASAQAGGRTRSELEIRLLIAQAEVAMNHLPEASQSLVQALALAQPGKYLRVFLDKGGSLRALILECTTASPILGQERLLSFASNLLKAFSNEPGVCDPQASLYLVSTSFPAVEKLSQQEERVLRLLREGLSNSEIAEELVVSVNTIKTHLKSIYRKLSVNSRRAARNVARHLELIS